MLKQSASRNQRYRGFKVKHVLQMYALLAVCIWLLNQARNTSDKNEARISNVTSEQGTMKLGRKDLDLRRQGSSSNNESGEVEAEGEGEESEEVEDLIEEEDRFSENQNNDDTSLLEDKAAMNKGDENLQYPKSGAVQE